MIRLRFLQISENFEDTKEFLKALNILNEQNDRLSLKKQFVGLGTGNKQDNLFKSLLLKEMLRKTCSLHKVIHEYLANFAFPLNGFEYIPSSSVNIRESWLRNLFIELDLIEYHPSTSSYIIKEQYRALFKDFLGHAKLSPQRLKVIQDNNEKIGLEAELAVIEFERVRLAKRQDLSQLIEHVSKHDVLAGYDILSWEDISKPEEALPRYIEVKAVSITDNGFFWSRNEMSKAKLYAEQYYLYLLPVVQHNKFDISELEIIPNPIVNILNNTKNWKHTVESYFIERFCE